MNVHSHGYAYRAAILYCVGDPHQMGPQACCYHEDGILWVEDGRIKAVGPAEKILNQLPQRIPLETFAHHLILPGFVDTHIHYPQTEMIAAYGEQLLSWLNTYTFPTELQFADANHASKVADVFLDELLRNGTTSALVFGTVHPQSVDAFFQAAQQRGLRMIAGKVMMDRHAPDALCDNAEQSYHDSKALIERWHGVDRLQYAVTPRFAPTSTPQQLEKAGQLLQEHPGVYLHTHLSENTNEVAWVQALFPEAANYLDVYDRAGLLSRRSVFAHGIHLCDAECARLAATGSAIAHCPTSNLFLGSGLFPLDRLQQHGVTVGLGTDVGGGTSFSMLRTLDEAYKIQQLRGHTLDPFQALYLATLGGAKALDLDHSIGSLQAGFEADFSILDLHATPLMAFRMPHCRTLQETLFVLNTLGDDRCIERTYALGRCVHQKETS
ncbi:MAG: guanine deaminase [Pseudomonadota bacterium]|nr:guanine deaminase [Pseudomonadota bacterium]